jgi:hypothetical protein
VTRRRAHSIPPWWWISLAAGGLTLLLVLVLAWSNSDPSEDVGAMAALIALVASIAAAAAALKVLPQYEEWADEHLRYPEFEFWLEIGQDQDHPGESMREIGDESELPAEPMFALDNDSAIVRACVKVIDRFPLRDCVVNVVVPSEWTINTVEAVTPHRVYPAVTANARVNPSGDHGCRFTVLKDDFSPNSHFTAVATIHPPTGVVEPVRVMAELTCTPAPESDTERFRFALVAPRDWRGTEGSE